MREDLLAPLVGDNPAGSSLRYDRVYDQIKEARTEEDESLPAGAWERQAKRADFKLVAKLASDALATKSKDLQLAAWLGEALIKLEGISQLAPVLKFCLELQQNFWEVLYPEIDEGDLGLRVVPLQWAANRYATLVYAAGLTRQSISFYEYKAARVVGREEDANDNEQQRELREQAISSGKLTSEALDEAIAATPKSFYVELEASLSLAEEAQRELNVYCEEHYGEDGPSFRALRDAIEEVQNLVRSLLRDKRQLEPGSDENTPDDDVVSEGAATDEEEGYVAWESTSTQEERGEESPIVRSRADSKQRSTKGGGQTATPESWSDALSRIETAVAYMYTQEPDSPLPFLLRSSMRLAELRVVIASSQHEDLVAPPTKLRQSLKSAAGSGDSMEVHRQALEALGSPWGRGWLDLYRYLWTSCRELGWELQQRSIAGVVQQLLHDEPNFPGWMLNDDTPVANAETVRWITEEIAPSPVVGTAQDHDQAVMTPVTLPVFDLASGVEVEASETAGEEDLFVTAQTLTAKGEIQTAIHLLARDAAHQPVGRLRYGRNLQIAELCVQSENFAVAVPVLQSLVREVEERKLESWEPLGTAARPYLLLLQCAPIGRLDTQHIFERLCAIDPSVALSIAPPIAS
nr:type VI secretion system protein TssA [Granulicella sp. dw_53]